MGIFFILFIFLSGLLVSSASAFEIFKGEELVVLGAEIEVETQERAKLPFKLSQDCYVSQDFWFLHPAIDIAAPRGTPVYAVRDGKVEKVEYDHFGYGNKIIIDHGNKLKSLYAHLAKIEVKEEEGVSQETIIGRVGSTGWATGSHLHLEIQENGRYLNPKTFIHQL